MKEATEVYFGGRMLIEDVIPRSKADVEMLMRIMDRFAARHNFEITDMNFEVVGVLGEDEDPSNIEKLKSVSNMQRKRGSEQHE